MQQEEFVVCDTDNVHSAKQMAIDRHAFQKHLSGLQIDRFTAWESVWPRCTDVAPSLGESEKRKMFEKHILSVPSIDPESQLLEYFCSEFLPKHVTDGRVLWRQVESKMRQDVRLRRVKGVKENTKKHFVSSCVDSQNVESKYQLRAVMFFRNNSSNNFYNL